LQREARHQIRMDHMESGGGGKGKRGGHPWFLGFGKRYAMSGVGGRNKKLDMLRTESFRNFRWARREKRKGRGAQFRVDWFLELVFRGQGGGGDQEKGTEG